MRGSGEFVADRGSLEVRLWDEAIEDREVDVVQRLRTSRLNEPAMQGTAIVMSAVQPSSTRKKREALPFTRSSMAASPLDQTIVYRSIKNERLDVVRDLGHR